MSITLDQALSDYLSVRRALGFKLDRAQKLLTQFVSYLHEQDVDTVLTEYALAWVMQPRDAPRWWQHRMSTVRGFAAFLSTIDPRVQVPPPGLIRSRPSRATPYLYSDSDIAALVRAAATLPRPLGAATYQTLIGLLAVTGMRVGEAIGLDRGDLDTDRDQGLLTVRGAKFGKTRLLPLHPDTVAALRGYLRTRDVLLPAPASPALLVSTVGTRLGYDNVWRTFHRLLTQVGLTSRSASCQPRIHDLRH